MAPVLLVGALLVLLLVVLAMPLVALVPLHRRPAARARAALTLRQLEHGISDRSKCHLAKEHHKYTKKNLLVSFSQT